MSDANPDETGKQEFEVQVRWPFETYINSPVVNQFSIRLDDGQGYIAFGHLPPLAVGSDAPPDKLDIPVLGAYSVRPSFLLSLRDVLNNVIASSPDYFAPYEAPHEDGAGKG